MNLSALDFGLWVGGFVAQIALFTILLYRGRWRRFPVFTTIIGWNILSSAVIYLLYTQHAWIWYARAYWSYSAFDFVLQLGVIWEIARIIMRPMGIWSQEARRFFLLWAALGILLAATLAWFIAPPADSLAGSLKVKAFMFTGFVICELCLVMLVTADRYGLGWRNHVMALVTGWSVWALVSILTDGLHVYFGSVRYFINLTHLPMFVYLAALCYWSFQFWANEPQRRPMPVELQDAIRNMK